LDTETMSRYVCVFVDQQIVTYSPRVKTGALLPEFPAVTDVRLTDDVTEEKVQVSKLL